MAWQTGETWTQNWCVAIFPVPWHLITIYYIVKSIIFYFRALETLRNLVAMNENLKRQEQQFKVHCKVTMVTVVFDTSLSSSNIKIYGVVSYWQVVINLPWWARLPWNVYHELPKNIIVHLNLPVSTRE